ncbi:hypothetical protein ACLOJK_000464 [Asimina triloba]
MATLSVPEHVPSPAEDAENLKKAFQGWGTNEKAVISILAHRNAAQRTLIRQAYQQIHKEDLIKRLESEISGDFEKAVYRWMFEPAEREAILANVATIKESHVDDRVLIEIACVSSPNELLTVKKTYQARYKHSLEEDVASHTRGDFRKLLVALIGTYRYDGEEVNGKLAQAEAKILHDAIKAKDYGNEEIIRILTTRSKAQLNATINCYKDEFGTSINKTLDDPGNKFASALRVATRCLTFPQKYFEKLLREAINKSGTDEDALSRVIVTRAEKDLQEIKELYFKRNSVALSQAVGKETSGEYKKFLLSLLGE